VVNPKSGGGKAAAVGLADKARGKGIHCIELGPGDDLRTLVLDAIDDQTDVVGVAGGDGSQALVAEIVAERGLALVCIPAGTRNHFALDLGLDREDVLAGLEAFDDDAVERHVDLGFVNDRVFVNNVSLGVYARVVQSPEYRDNKARTTANILGEVFRPGAPPFGLRFRGADGEEHVGAQVVEVSNNPYELARLGAFGTRSRLDGGVLGIDSCELTGAADVAKIVALETVGRIEDFRGLLRWEAPEFIVESDQPVEVAIDGEASKMDPPLVFRTHASAVRVRTPRSATGEALAAVRPKSWTWTVSTLLKVAAGRPQRAAEPS
jgi:diacylglycerol kinase family enzyme